LRKVKKGLLGSNESGGRNRGKRGRAALSSVPWLKTRQKTLNWSAESGGTVGIMTRNLREGGARRGYDCLTRGKLRSGNIKFRRGKDRKCGGVFLDISRKKNKEGG